MNASANRLAELLQDPTAYRAAAHDLLRSVGVGPTDLARLTLTPSTERRAALAALLAAPPAAMQQQSPAATEQPAPAEAEPASVHTVANLPAWRRQLIEEHARRVLARN